METAYSSDTECNRMRRHNEYNMGGSNEELICMTATISLVTRVKHSTAVLQAKHHKV